MKNIVWLNSLEKSAEKEFLACCASKEWAKSMVEKMPFENLKQLLRTAEEEWFILAAAAKIEAFASHPQIGDVSALRKKFATSNQQKHAKWSGEEQAQVSDLDEKILQELASYNKKYLQKFGFIFIVCATEQTAENILKSLKTRIHNSYKKELENASLEQNKIILNRIHKML